MKPRSLTVLLLLNALLCGVLGAQVKPRPGSADARMIWLENGVVKLGCDLDFGGAITWFSLKDGPNVINNFDAGRQVQMSFYGGPVPYSAQGQEPAPHWGHLGWNPIQCGDDFRHGSRITAQELGPGGDRLRLRCVPLQWPLNRVEAECEFALDIALHGASANVHCRLENHRSDRTPYPGRHQELPAVYANGRFHRVATYQGDAPFTGAPVSFVTGKPPGSAPWHLWSATEGWAALVGDDDWGIGVWNPDAALFTGGFAGAPGSGGTEDSPTGYLAPLRTEILDADIVYDYQYDLILGTLDEIRAHVSRRSAGRPLPSWDFAKSREGWNYAGMTDAGWPIQGALRFEAVPPGGHLLSPERFWNAAQAPRLRLNARCEGGTGKAKVRILWRRLGEKHADPQSVVTAELTTDGQPNHLVIDLVDHPNYKGGMVQLIIDPPDGRFVLEGVVLEAK